MLEKCIHGFVQEMLLGGQFGSKPIADNYRTKEASILIGFRGHIQQEYVVNSGNNGRNKL